MYLGNEIKWRSVTENAEENKENVMKKVRKKK